MMYCCLQNRCQIVAIDQDKMPLSYDVVIKYLAHLAACSSAQGTYLIYAV